MDYKTMKIAELRKLAEEAGVEGYEDLEREDLIKALSPDETPEGEGGSEPQSETEEEDKKSHVY